MEELLYIICVNLQSPKPRMIAWFLFESYIEQINILSNQSQVRQINLMKNVLDHQDVHGDTCTHYC